MTNWQIKVSEKKSASQNMELDYEELMNLSSSSAPSLRFYAWERDCATYGYFLQPNDYLNFKALNTYNLEIARRPTGGGIIFHLYDLAFSVIIPASHPGYSTNTLENYAFISNWVIEAIKQFSGHQLDPHLLKEEQQSHYTQFCMAKPTKYDVMIGGKKVGGAAQRRTKQGFLHQGSISIALMPDNLLEEVLLPGTPLIEEMKRNSYALLPANASLAEIEEARDELKHCMVGE